MTLGLGLWLEVRDRPPGSQTAPATPEPALLTHGDFPPALEETEIVFPLEQYVIHGQTQWLPFLLQMGDPDFLADGKSACDPLLSALPADATCPVEYLFALGLDREGRIRGVRARVLSGKDSPCLAYVQCRLPGTASVRLAVPQSELVEHSTELYILDKVNHARRPSERDEEREISQLREALVSPDPPDLASMPAAERLQAFLRQDQQQRLAALLRRRQGR